MSAFYAKWMAKAEQREDRRKTIRSQLGICETDSFDEEDDELALLASQTKSDDLRRRVRAQLGIVEGEDSFDED